MATLRGLNSCAVGELAGIRYGPQPQANAGAYVAQSPGEPEHSVKVALFYPPGTAIVFSDPQPYKYGRKLANYIRRHRLGTVRMVEGRNYKYTDGHKVRVWLWLYNKEKADAFEKRMIDSKKWAADWRMKFKVTTY